MKPNLFSTEAQRATHLEKRIAFRRKANNAANHKPTELSLAEWNTMHPSQKWSHILSVSEFRTTIQASLWNDTARAFYIYSLSL